MNRKAFGRRINQARKEQHMTSEALSIACGVNAVFIRQIEGGNRLPSLPVFLKICNALHISPAYLLQDNLETYESTDKDLIINLISSFTPKQLRMARLILAALKESIDEKDIP